MNNEKEKKEISTEKAQSEAKKKQLELAKKIAKVLFDKKGREIKVYHVEKQTVLCDYYVIATGTSTTQLRSLCDEVEFELGKEGILPRHIEGHDSGFWTLIDYGNVVVHIFSREGREFYKLDKLWSEAVEVDITDITGEEGQTRG